MTVKMELIIYAHYHDKDFCFSPSDGKESQFVYRAAVRQVIERLEIIGVTYEKSRQAFSQGLENIYQQRWEKHVLAQHLLTTGRSTLDEHEEAYYLSIKDETEWNFCHNYTFEKWLSYVLTVDTTLPISNTILVSSLPIAEEINSYFLCFPNEERFALRAILEEFDMEDEVILDCSELVNGGYLGLHDELCNVEPVITILTEGPTDIDILRPSLSILYPHLEEYFAFMDFRSLNIEANAAALVKLVKAFVGSGIKQKIVALFDNDAAATDALRSLQINKLPEHIKIVQLPYLPLGKEYATIGPQGTHTTDINGCACSIELYLGEDILRDKTGALTAIRWGSYINGVKRWQGEIENKKELQKKYLDTVYKADTPDQLPNHDWSGMNLVLQEIFKAFH